MTVRVRGLRRLAQAWADLRGKSARLVVDLVCAQIAIARSGAELARATAAGTVDRARARAEMAEVEHKGDAARASLVRVLGRVLVTPIDREDLYRLSRSVDDVLDQLRDYVREIDLFGPRDLSFAVEPLEALIDGLDRLETAARMMIEAPASVTTAALATRKACTRVRQLHQSRLSTLLAGPPTVDMLRERELLARLDGVGRRLREAADALADAMLKRNH
jgi:Phosphate transport regulator (distant homolog of PhoU)